MTLSERLMSKEYPIICDRVFHHQGNQGRHLGVRLFVKAIAQVYGGEWEGDPLR